MTKILKNDRVKIKQGRAKALEAVALQDFDTDVIPEDDSVQIRLDKGKLGVIEATVHLRDTVITKIVEKK